MWAQLANAADELKRPKQWHIHELCRPIATRIDCTGMGMYSCIPTDLQSRTQEGADGVEASPEMLNILGVFSCLV